MEMADQWGARKVEVTKGIENLVTHEFVFVAQAAFVEDLVAADDHGVVQGSAKGQPRGAQVIHLVEKTEGAGAADFRFKGVAGEMEEIVLARDGEAVEIDFHAQRKGLQRTGRWGQGGEALAVGDGNRLEHADGAPRGILFDDSRAFDEKHEGRSAAVHGGNLTALDFHHQIVDAAARQRRHEMFHRGHGNVAAIAQRGTEPGVRDTAPMGGDAGIAAADVATAEDDAGTGFGGMQGEGDVFAAVHRGAAAIDGAFQSPLQGRLGACFPRGLFFVGCLFHLKCPCGK